MTLSLNILMSFNAIERRNVAVIKIIQDFYPPPNNFEVFRQHTSTGVVERYSSRSAVSIASISKASFRGNNLNSSGSPRASLVF